MNGQSHVRFMQAPCDNGVVESHGETLQLRCEHVKTRKKMRIRELGKSIVTTSN
uniref:Uncharacterized protein n=1 Tax=Solanum tuberosum TaxID=4113 RepID=M1D254_SOLTU